MGMKKLMGIKELKDEELFIDNLQDAAANYAFDALDDDFEVLVRISSEDGYDFVLSKRWNLELTAGVGAVYRFEKKYDVGTKPPSENNGNKWGIAPVNLGVTLSYVIF